MHHKNNFAHNFLSCPQVLHRDMCGNGHALYLYDKQNARMSSTWCWWTKVRQRSDINGSAILQTTRLTNYSWIPHNLNLFDLANIKMWIQLRYCILSFKWGKLFKNILHLCTLAPYLKQVDVPKTEEPGVNSSRVPKKEHLEFHFSELPGIILPGQTLQFPVLFRSKQPGFFYETIYLLTHPRICTETGLLYSLNLTGGCVEGEPKVSELFQVFYF